MNMSAASLADWVDERHLSDQAVAAFRDRFSRDEFASIVVDGFIRPEKLSALQQCFDTDAAFSSHYGLLDPTRASDGEQSVDEQLFNEAPDDSRLAHELVMSGPAPGRRESRGWLANLEFTSLLTSPEFAAFLCAATGIDGLDRMTYMPRIMQFGDFCRAHSDSGDRRRLCLLFYIDGDWRDGFGGRFQHLRNGAVRRSVDPIANRVVIHRPRSDQIHQVEPIGASGRAWRRQTYSIWFSAKDTGTA